MNAEVLRQTEQAREAARKLAGIGTDVKNAALLQMARALEQQTETILAANREDVTMGQRAGLSGALIDRLTLNPGRVRAMSEGLRQVAALPDPVGQVIDGSRRPNGLQIQRVRVPFGVIGVIYESRPNVTVDAAGLCLKAGNAVVLRGGSEAIHTNRTLAHLISRAGETAGLPAGCIQIIATTDREAALTLMQAERTVDLLIPRGGEGLKKVVLENARVPVLTSLGGVCHTFVDASANLQMASDIAFNAKVSRPSVCNAMETLLVHREVSEMFLPGFCQRLTDAGVEIRGCARTCHIVPNVLPATEEDWAAEYLALILAIRVVDSLEEAIAHIHHYGTGHSEAIVTQDYTAAQRFVDEVDAACVYVNASTRFTDGFEFGMGAEVGISTQKLHARGPVGLTELTTYKTIVRGNGQIRG